MKMSIGTVIRTALAAVVTASSLATAGCSIWNPYRDGDDSAYEESASLSSAVTYAENTRDRYYKQIQEQTFINKASGIALIGAAAAAGFFGIQGSHTNVVAGLGVGGAGIFGANSLLYSYPRLGVYVAGAGAISCSLSLYAPFGSFFREDFDQTLKEFDDQTVLVRKLLEESGLTEGPVKDFASGILNDTKATRSNAVKVQTALGMAGVQLYESVQVIHAKVSTALLSSEPNLEEVIKDIGKNIQTNAKFITDIKTEKTANPISLNELTKKLGSQAPTPFSINSIRELAKTDEKVRNRPSPPNLAAQAQILQTQRLVLDKRVSDFKALPETTSLKACAEFEIEQPFVVLPQPTLTVNLRDGGGGIVRVSGGKRPYNYGWVGPAPIGAVEITGEAAPADQAQGLEIKVTGTGTVPDQALQLQVRDSAEATRTVLVSITGTGSGAGQPAGSPTALRDVATRQAQRNSTLDALQERLIGLGCMAKTRLVSGRSVDNQDGRYGPVTEEAVERLKIHVAAEQGVEAAVRFTGFTNSQAAYERVLAAAKATTARC